MHNKITTKRKKGNDDMYSPFDHENKDNGSTNSGNYGGNPNPYNGGNYSNPENHTEWEGSNYHYVRPQIPPQESPVYSWERPAEQPQNFVQTDYKPAKKPHKGKKIFVKALAGVMACVMISAGSIFCFTALVNNGTIKLNNGSGSSSDPAFTVTKLVDNSAKSTNTATNGQLTLQEIAQKVIPSVVCIQNYQVGQNAQYTLGGQNGNPAAGGDDSAVSPASEGSGIVATSDGYIITNAHVVADATSLKVVLSNGTTYAAKLIGSDSVTDLAVIKIEATGLTPAEFGSSDDLKVADTVMAVGNPGGMEFNSSVTVGYVSALNREITNSETGYTMKCIQTDAAINPGNSGGALVNMYGQVIGINSSKIVATGYEGLGFSIPINVAQPVISDLKQYGYVKDRAVLGISGQFIDSVTSRFYNLPTGMYVNSVTSSEVTSAGIKKGDVITKIDGKGVTSQNVITSVVTSKKPGDTVTLSVTSAITGESFTATVKLSQATGK